MENVFIMDHPLIQHKISMLRNKNTGTNEFRKLIEEIAVLMGYEALRDLPLEEVEVETPIMKNAEELPVGKVSSATFLYIGQQFLTVFCEGDELRDGAQLSLQ